MAGNIGFDRDAVSEFEVFDRRVNSDDLSSRLVSKNMIGFDYHGPDATCVPEVDIRSVVKIRIASCHCAI
jgi:hypothetical protein